MADENPIPLWRQHQSNEIVEVISGLRDGDLRPLAEYLKAGGLPESPRDSVALPSWIATELASMIDEEAWCFYHLKLKANKKKGWTRSIMDFDRRMEVGIYIERRLRVQRREYKRIIDAACKKFDIGERTAATCLAFVRDFIESWRRAQGAEFSEDRLWSTMVERYCKDE